MEVADSENAARARDGTSIDPTSILEAHLRALVPRAVGLSEFRHVEIGFDSLVALAENGSLGAIGGTEPAHDLSDVHLHSAFRHAEFARDHLVGFALVQADENLLLTKGQTGNQKISFCNLWGATIFR